MSIKLAEKINILNRSTLESISDPSEQMIIKRFSEAGMELFEADYSFVWYMLYHEKDFELAYKSPNIPYDPAPPRSTGTNFRVQREGKPLLISEVEKVDFIREDAKKHMKSVMVVPIVYKWHTYGNFIFSYFNRKDFDEEDESLAVALGNSAAQSLAIHRTESNRAQLATIVESSEDAIISKNLDGVIMTWNKGAEKLYGYKADEMIGKSVEKIIPKNKMAEERELMEKIQSGKRFEVYDTVREKKNNRLVYVSMTASPLKDPRGKVIGASNIARDITERKQLEREQRNLLKKKDEFLSLASHELKTPATSIKGYAQLLQENTTDETAKKYLEKIDKQTNKLTRLVNDLLDVSRIQTGKMKIKKEEFDFNELLQEMVEEARMSSLEHEIKIKGKAERLVRGDRDRIGQVVMNLLINAMKYSPKNKKIEVILSSSGSELKVEVKDHGIGISKEDQQKIFNRFFQTEMLEQGNFSGMGLGLYITNYIIERHKGKMSVKSKLGKGSVFTFTIPIENKKTE